MLTLLQLLLQRYFAGSVNFVGISTEIGFLLLRKLHPAIIAVRRHIHVHAIRPCRPIAGVIIIRHSHLSIIRPIIIVVAVISHVTVWPIVLIIIGPIVVAQVRRNTVRASHIPNARLKARIRIGILNS